MLPLTAAMPAMGSTIGKGLVFSLTQTTAGDYAARVLSVVAIYSADGAARRHVERDDRHRADGGSDEVEGDHAPAPRRARSGRVVLAARRRRSVSGTMTGTAECGRAVGGRGPSCFRIEGCHTSSNHFASATSRSPTGSSSRRCANTRASTASPTTGISSTSASRAVGGAALVFTEATAVTADGRISPDDLGIWDDAHVDGLARIVHFVHGQGSAAGMQLAHAGRKGSTKRPWDGQGRIAPEDGGWTPVGPTDEPFADSYPVPRALTLDEIPTIVAAFRAAAQPRPRRRLRPRRDARRARLPDPRISVAAVESRARTRTADRSTIASVCASKSSTRSARSGRSGCRCSSGSPPPTGPRAAGTSSSRSDCRGGCASTASI